MKNTITNYLKIMFIKKKCAVDEEKYDKYSNTGCWKHFSL